MKYAPLILSLACLLVGGTLIAFGHETVGASLIGAFLGQFAPAPHAALAAGSDQ